MKVLLSSPYKGVVGGIAKWTEHVLKYLPLYACDKVDLDICPMGRSVLVNSMSKINRLWYAIKDYAGILRRYNNQIKRADFDVVHICSSASWGLLRDVYMLKLAQKRRIKTVVHFHFGRIPELFRLKDREWRWLMRVLTLTDLAIVMDKQSYDVLQANGYSNVVYIPNPLSPEIFSIIDNYGCIEREKRTILFVGHVIKNKGIIELVEACKAISGIKLVLVGKVLPEMKTILYQMANTDENGWLKIKGEESFDEVIKDMCGCGIFVLPSYTEGFPNVILEGMACGCPIVATSVGAIPEMLSGENGGKCGVCIEPKNVKILRDSILYLLENSQLAEKYGMMAHERVVENYSMEKVCSLLVDSWQKLIDKN